MMRPLGLYLAEFRPDGTAPAPVFAALPLLPDPGEDTDAAFPSCDDVELVPPLNGEAPPLLDVAPAEPLALLEGPAEPGADMAAALAAQAAEHAEALAAARAAWVAGEGAALAARLDQAFNTLEAQLGDALASLLEPFLAKAAQSKALGQLREALGTLFGGGETQAVAVSGPADLLAALRDSYGDRPGVNFIESDAPDVAITLGDTRIRSQLRAWTRKLDAALGASA